MAGLGFTVGILSIFLTDQVNVFLISVTIHDHCYLHAQFYLTPDKIGLVSLSTAVMYVLTAPFVGKIADKMVFQCHSE